MRVKSLVLAGVVAMSLGLSGCGATYTAVSKSELDVQTKMSDTIFLDPVAASKRSVFVQIRNTSDKPNIQVESAVRAALTQKGYRLEDDPEKATYWLQANVLKVGKTDKREADGPIGGFGGAITGGAIGSTIGSGDGKTAAVVAGALIGAIADATVKDIYFTMITDIQIAEKSKGQIRERSEANLSQGSHAQTQVDYKENTDRKKYRTRIVSTANKANLEYQEAEPALINGLVTSLSGVL